MNKTIVIIGVLTDVGRRTAKALKSSGMYVIGIDDPTALYTREGIESVDQLLIGDCPTLLESVIELSKPEYSITIRKL